MGNHMRLSRHRGSAFAAGLIFCAASGGLAAAQSASSSLSNFSRGPSSYESPVNVSTRDANGNTEIVNGVMQAAQGSVFANVSGVATASSGAGSTSASAGGAGGTGSAVAIGNNLNVVVNGDNNTVIVNSSQTNTGAISATTVLNGKVDLNDSQ
jgi:holdfast attachment protein HfaA